MYRYSKHYLSRPLFINILIIYFLVTTIAIINILVHILAYLYNSIYSILSNRIASLPSKMTAPIPITTNRRVNYFAHCQHYCVLSCFNIFANTTGEKQYIC